MPQVTQAQIGYPRQRPSFPFHAEDAPGTILPWQQQLRKAGNNKSILLYRTLHAKTFQVKLSFEKLKLERKLSKTKSKSIHSFLSYDAKDTWNL